MPRPRNKANRDLPEGLYFKGKKGYVFRRIDDTWKSLGHNKARAVSLARRYNDTYRIDPELSHGIRSTSHGRKTLKPMSVFFSRVSKRYFEEEKPSKSTYELFQRRLVKLDKALGQKYGPEIDLEAVNQVLELHGASGPFAYNRWISFMTKVFDYAVDESIMNDNPARRKKRKPYHDKKRKRMTMDDFNAVYRVAPVWMKVAMLLALESTHASNEICNIRYDDIEMLAEPQQEDGLLVYGYLKIHRQKVKKHESSRVRIPVTSSLLKIIEQSRDEIVSPYVVHRRPLRNFRNRCDDLTKVNPKFLSEKFSYYRDQAKVKSELPKQERPTFHEIRGLSIHLYDKAGYDPQRRAAHSNPNTTSIYKSGHVQWVTVAAAELGIWDAVPK
ncbi:integrase [Photobacterium atrarenae]|uniref:Integrase n=1 Tax=Photobacterium atrarenae TaxID=865757 RepID=A0ABY5GJL7_9GAMM|nr:integrase [Photobacterium atrarenae]UTV29361.1 integrase [Photobacterium atrarenae]